MPSSGMAQQSLLLCAVAAVAALPLACSAVNLPPAHLWERLPQGPPVLTPARHPHASVVDEAVPLPSLQWQFYANIQYPQLNHTGLLVFDPATDMEVLSPMMTLPAVCNAVPASWTSLCVDACVSRAVFVDAAGAVFQGRVASTV